MTWGKTGERAVVVAALDASPDLLGVTDLDPAAGGRPVVIREGLAHGLLEWVEPEHGGRADRGRRGPHAGAEAERKREANGGEKRSSAVGHHR
jgi:hypothetical protein